MLREPASLSWGRADGAGDAPASQGVLQMFGRLNLQRGVGLVEKHVVSLQGQPSGGHGVLHTAEHHLLIHPVLGVLGPAGTQVIAVHTLLHGLSQGRETRHHDAQIGVGQKDRLKGAVQLEGVHPGSVCLVQHQLGPSPGQLHQWGREGGQLVPPTLGPGTGDPGQGQGLLQLLGGGVAEQPLADGGGIGADVGGGGEQYPFLAVGLGQ